MEENRTSASVVGAALNLVDARMKLFISEVSSRVDDRATDNMAAARTTASRLRRVSQDVMPLMEDDWSHVTPGPGAALLLRVLRAIASGASMARAALDEFLSEHRALIEEDAVDTLYKFLDWVGEQPKLIEPMLQEYRQQVAAGLRDDAEFQSELAKTWDATTRDGFGDG